MDIVISKGDRGKDGRDGEVGDKGEIVSSFLHYSLKILFSILVLNGTAKLHFFHSGNKLKVAVASKLLNIFAAESPIIWNNFPRGKSFGI